MSYSFRVSACLALLVIVLALALVPSVDDRRGGKFDGTGAIGLVAGLCCVLTAITKGNDWGWGSASTIGLLLGGLVILLVWVRL